MAIDVSCELATTPVLLIFYKRPGLFDDLNLERSRHDNARAAQTLFVSLFPLNATVNSQSCAFISCTAPGYDRWALLAIRRIFGVLALRCWVFSVSGRIVAVVLFS